MRVNCADAGSAAVKRRAEANTADLITPRDLATGGPTSLHWRDRVAFLVQILLPAYDNERRPFAPAEFVRIRRELTEKFGGVTAYTRAPAEGFWEDDRGRTHRDDVVIVEVMTDALEREWWGTYARELATRFAQQELIRRAITLETLTVGRGE